MFASVRAMAWRRRDTGNEPIDAGVDDSSEARVSGLARETRRELLSTIGDFLLDHDLAITPANLAAACDAFSGASPSLGRAVAGRIAAGEKITQSWLSETHAGPAAKDAGDAPRRLSDELDRSIKRFARNASDARSAAGEYGVHLDRHVMELESLEQGEGTARALAVLARQMAERAQAAEADLRASEREASHLRRRLNRARREAERDHLTGLPNRRAFEFELHRQYAEARAEGGRLCLAFCDVDHFKLVNDRHGHDTGDRILKLIAKALASISDNNCHVARHGGEEFVLLFRGQTLGQAIDRLDGAREDLAKRRLVDRETEQAIGQVTFSAGVADAMAHAGPEDALRAADEALLRAKDQGRNVVVAAKASPKPVPSAVPCQGQ
jgi:diguanylate cyclase